jgi:hypothetical protein
LRKNLEIGDWGLERVRLKLREHRFQRLYGTAGKPCPSKLQRWEFFRSLWKRCATQNRARWF